MSRARFSAGTRQANNPTSATLRSRLSSANRVANNQATVTRANRQTAQQALREYAARRTAMATSGRFSMRPVAGVTIRGNPTDRGARSRPVSGGVWTASQRAAAMRNTGRDQANQANAMKRVPVPATIDRSGGRMNLRFNSQAGRRYVVQTSSDRTSWKDSGRVERGTGSPMAVRVDATSGQRYIRVVPAN
jgi:hypothetical protein